MHYAYSLSNFIDFAIHLLTQTPSTFPNHPWHVLSPKSPDAIELLVITLLHSVHLENSDGDFSFTQPSSYRPLILKRLVPMVPEIFTRGPPHVFCTLSHALLRSSFCDTSAFDRRPDLRCLPSRRFSNATRRDWTKTNVCILTFLVISRGCALKLCESPSYQEGRDTPLLYSLSDHLWSIIPSFMAPHRTNIWSTIMFEEAVCHLEKLQVHTIAVMRTTFSFWPESAQLSQTP